MDTQAVTLRPATASDIPTLIALEQSVAGTHLYIPILEASEWEEELASGSVFLIYVDSEAVGNVSLQLKGPAHLHISVLVVTPPYQGRGIGREVLTQVLREHADKERIDLTTHPDNPARRLYESLGFEVESRIENCWGDGEPRLLYVLDRTH